MAEWRRVILSPARFEEYLSKIPQGRLKEYLAHMPQGVQFVADPLVPDNRGFALDEDGNVVAVFKFGNEEESNG